MRRVDRAFGLLLLLGAAGHTAGTLLRAPWPSDVFVWSLGSSVAAGLLAVLNLVRAGRTEDRTLAAVTAVGTACWAAIALAFGWIIHDELDPRVLIHVVASLGLVACSIAALFRPRAAAAVGPARASG